MTPSATGPIYHWKRTVPGFRDAILHMQQSMAVIEADYQAMHHHDAVRKHVPDDQPLHEQHFPPSRHVPMNLPMVNLPMNENPRMASDLSDV